MTADGAEDFNLYLTGARARVEAALDRALPVPPACPALLSEAMRYSLFAGGKRFRPILTLASAHAAARHLGQRGDEVQDAEAAAMPAACALELIHTYSLIHDDLPAMDNDSLRRGRPTAHVVYGEGLAILAGDGLLAEAFSLLAHDPGPPKLVPAARRLQTIGLIARAAGATGMAGGQAIDLAVAGALRAVAAGAAAFDADLLRDMHARKTGTLVRAAAMAGCVMAGGDEALASVFDAYAADLGLAFQIVDDILDVEGGDRQLGKTAGKDEAAGKPTYPAVFGLVESKRLARQAVERAVAVIRDAGLGESYLPAIAGWVASRTF